MTNSPRMQGAVRGSVSHVLMITLVLVQIYGAHAFLSFPGEKTVRALCSSQSIGYGNGQPGQGEEMVVMFTDTHFYRANKTGQSCDHLQVVESRTSLLLQNNVGNNVTVEMGDIVFAACQLISAFGQAWTSFLTTICTKDNQIVSAIAIFPLVGWPSSYQLLSMEPLPAPVTSAQVLCVTNLQTSSLTVATIIGTADSVTIMGGVELHIPLPLAAHEKVESASVHVTAAQQQEWCPSFQVLYVRSVVGGQKESFFISVQCSNGISYNVKQAYFVARPSSAFLTPDFKTVWVQSLAQKAWLLQQDAGSQQSLLYRQFEESDVWLDQIEISSLDFDPLDPLAQTSERAFASFSSSKQRSNVFTRFSPDPVGSVAVKSTPLASSSVFYFTAHVVVHIFVTLSQDAAALNLHCSAFARNASAVARRTEAKDDDNCVVTGCTGFACCVQQPDTFLNRCQDSCMEGYTCLKNHTCV